MLCRYTTWPDACDARCRVRGHVKLLMRARPGGCRPPGGKLHDRREARGCSPRRSGVVPVRVAEPLKEPHPTRKMTPMGTLAGGKKYRILGDLVSRW